MPPQTANSHKANPGDTEGENSISHTPELLKRIKEEVRKQIKDVFSRITEDTTKQTTE